MPLLFFKVWDRPRKTKMVIPIDSDDSGGDLLLRLIAKASEKMKINGSSLVLEKDGTMIAEDIVLEHFQNEVFMLLQHQEEWQDETAVSTTTSIATTVTNTSSLNEDQTISNDEVMTVLPNNGTSNGTIPLDSIQINTYTYQIDCNSEFMWHLFEIPWDALPKYMIDACEAGKQERHIITHIIHTVVNKMREIKHTIPSSAIKIVTKKLIDRFPQVFRDIDEDGVVISDGTYTVFKKILERNNYLNRTTSLKRKITEDVTNVKQDGKRARLAQRAGCSSWEPPLEENDDVLKDGSSVKETDINFKENMDNFYPNQSHFLNKNPTFEMIKAEWPILLTKEGSLYHFQKLTNSDLGLLPEIVQQRFPKFRKSAGMVKYEIDDNKSHLFLAFHIVSKYFGEDPGFYYKEVQEVNNNFILVDHTYPVIFKSTNKQLRPFHIIYEKKIANPDGFETFDEAFQTTFAMYFNFNLQYPGAVSLTLELFQRYFLKIHPDSGSKSNSKSKKTKNYKSRVITLINKLRNF